MEAEAPLPSPPERPATESSAIIGDWVAALIGDGDVASGHRRDP
jgi:hypothetical protein